MLLKKLQFQVTVGMGVVKALKVGTHQGTCCRDMKRRYAPSCVSTGACCRDSTQTTVVLTKRITEVTEGTGKLDLVQKKKKKMADAEVRKKDLLGLLNWLT